MRTMMLASLALFLVAAYTLTPAFGNTGLWISFLVFLGLRGISLGLMLPHRMRETFGAA